MHLYVYTHIYVYVYIYVYIYPSYLYFYICAHVNYYKWKLCSVHCGSFEIYAADFQGLISPLATTF